MAIVQAEIAFLAPCRRRPIVHENPSPDDFLPLQQHRVSITALRDERDLFELDRHGIEIVRTPGVKLEPSPEPDWTGYLRSLGDVIRDVTGASKVVALGNGVVRRSERASGHRRDGTTVPGRLAHSDFSRAVAGSRFWVEKTLPAEEARRRLNGRYAIYTVWRCLTEPPQDIPLAFCDLDTVDPDSVIGCDEITRTAEGGQTRFEFSVYRRDARQRWFYFPDLRTDDLLIFTGYDSDPTRPQGVPHAAFTDPTCPAHAAPRESADARLIAFFD